MTREWFHVYTRLEVGRKRGRQPHVGGSRIGYVIGGLPRTGSNHIGWVHLASLLRNRGDSGEESSTMRTLFDMRLGNKVVEKRWADQTHRLRPVVTLNTWEALRLLEADLLD